MSGKEITGRGFPQYRRSANGSNFYRIESEDRFTEVQVIGSRVVVHEVFATAYPELVRIRELLDGTGSNTRPITEQDFLAVLARDVEGSVGSNGTS
ncbi:MAG: hypothetical protein H6595_01425 [Flavobacteriales bacterium]|nr:hypothetical protein [Flavobacteriales bacterium]MCB9166120.1 hypothetical protein [Flavobacteriales bacterium]